jgi:hypothetical protein
MSGSKDMHHSSTQDGLSKPGGRSFYGKFLIANPFKYLLAMLQIVLYHAIL